jgi:hypothetical protein
MVLFLSNPPCIHIPEHLLYNLFMSDDLQHTEVQEPIRFGGWLFLVGFGVCSSPVLTISVLVKILSFRLDPVKWEYFNVPLGEYYVEHFESLVIFQLISNTIFLALLFYLISLFFSKKKKFSKYYIGILIIGFGGYLIDVTATYFIMPEVIFNEINYIAGLVNRIVALVIMIPYMLFSKRVKATFIN